MTEQRLISKASLAKLFDLIKSKGTFVYGPKNHNNRVDYLPLNAFEELTEDFIQTTQSAKAVAFPRTEKLFSYKKEFQKVDVSDFKPESIQNNILWGVRPCDAAGFIPLSSIFNWDIQDIMFNTRLSKTTIITYSCIKADDACFCTSVGGNPGNTAGSDIQLTPIGDNNYLAEILTPKGQAIVDLAPDLFNVSQTIDKQKYLANVPVQFNREELTKKLSTIFESEVWKAQSMRCLGCGACAFVCPTCACFDIQDQKHGSKGTRVRNWDSCGFSMFTMHTSGHNPREVQNQRWRQRLMHKFSYMPDRLNVTGCTGCGRCSRACPVDMNILEHIISIES